MDGEDAGVYCRVAESFNLVDFCAYGDKKRGGMETYRDRGRKIKEHA